MSSIGIFFFNLVTQTTSNYLFIYFFSRKYNDFPLNDLNFKIIILICINSKSYYLTILEFDIFILWWTVYFHNQLSIIIQMYKNI